MGRPHVCMFSRSCPGSTGCQPARATTLAARPSSGEAGTLRSCQAAMGSLTGLHACLGIFNLTDEAEASIMAKPYLATPGLTCGHHVVCSAHKPDQPVLDSQPVPHVHAHGRPDAGSAASGERAVHSGRAGLPGAPVAAADPEHRGIPGASALPTQPICGNGTPSCSSCSCPLQPCRRGPMR